MKANGKSRFIPGPMGMATIVGVFVLAMWLVAAFNLATARSIADVRALWVDLEILGVSFFWVSFFATTFLVVVLIAQTWRVYRQSRRQKTAHFVAQILGFALLCSWLANLYFVYVSSVNDGAYWSAVANEPYDDQGVTLARVDRFAPAVDCEQDSEGYRVELDVGDYVNICIPVAKAEEADLIAVTQVIGRFSGNVRYEYDMSLDEPDPELYWREQIRKRR